MKFRKGVHTWPHKLALLPIGSPAHPLSACSSRSSHRSWQPINLQNAVRTMNPINIQPEPRSSTARRLPEMFVWCGVVWCARRRGFPISHHYLPLPLRRRAKVLFGGPPFGERIAECGDGDQIVGRRLLDERAVWHFR